MDSKKKRKKNYRSRAHYSKSQERERNDSSRDYKERDNKGAVFTKDIENDISWWAKYPETMRMAANLPYAWPTGVPVVAQTCKQIGAAMLLPTTMGIGISKDSNSPANIQFRHLVAKIVQKLGGSGNGDPSDYAEYLLALDSIYAFIAWCTRVYGLGTCYSPENRFIPDALLTSEGVDAQDIRANYAQLRAWINLWINQIETYAAPADVALFDRHIQLMGNVYTDFPEPRGQIYMYTPHVFYQLDEANGKLVATSFLVPGDLTQLKKVSDIVTLGNALIRQMTSSQIYQDLSARIRRAYEERLYHINPMPEDYQITPVYSTEILLEIHNTVLVGPEKATSELDITQSIQHGDADLKFNPLMSESNMFSNIGYKNFVDVPIPGVIPPETTMIATRGLVTFEKTSTTNEYRITSCGTEIVHGVILAFFDGAGVLTWLPIGARYNTKSNAYVSQIAQVISTFDWAPFVSLTASAVGLIGDTTKIAIVADETVDLLNRVALESALDVPRV